MRYPRLRFSTSMVYDHFPIFPLLIKMPYIGVLHPYFQLHIARIAFLRHWCVASARRGDQRAKEIDWMMGTSAGTPLKIAGNRPWFPGFLPFFPWTSMDVPLFVIVEIADPKRNVLIFHRFGGGHGCCRVDWRHREAKVKSCRGPMYFLFLRLCAWSRPET